MNEDKFKKAVESCHLNFLIGSGASRNYFETLGDVENLLTELAKEKDSDQKRVVEASIKKDYYTKGIEGNRGLLDNSKVVNTTEFANTKKNYQNFLIALNIILLRRRSNIIGRQVNLFTTNMDLFIDRTLEDMCLEYNDGFSGKLDPVFSTSNYRKSIFQKSPHYENKAELPLFNLFKLHGSVTWKQVNDKVLLDKNLTTLNKISGVNTSGKVIEKFEKKNVAKSITQLIDDARSLNYDSDLEDFNKAYD